MHSSVEREGWRCGEPLHLPARIDRDISNLLKAYLEETQNQPRTLEWTDVRWVTLVDGVTVLQACSSAATSSKIAWSFTTSNADTDVRELEFRARLAAGDAIVDTLRELFHLLDRHLISGDLYPSRLDAALADLKKLAPAAKQVRAWVGNELVRFERARVLGFLHRFDFLNKARDADIQIDDSVFNLPFVRFARTRDSGSHPLVECVIQIGLYWPRRVRV